MATPPLREGSGSPLAVSDTHSARCAASPVRSWPAGFTISSPHAARGRSRADVPPAYGEPLVRTLAHNACLFTLLVLVALRPLISESYDSSVDSLTASLAAFAPPSPLVTLIFDGVVLLCALVCSVMRALEGKRPFQRTGLGGATALLLVAAVVSCLSAGNQRLAINAAIDWLTYPLMAMVLVELTTTAWRRRLLICAILASAVVQANQCLEQDARAAETWEYYLERKNDGFWEDQNVPLDSPKVRLFEQRLLSGEITGFLTHSNVTGAYLAMCALVAAGMAAARWREAGDPVSRGLSVLAALVCAGLLAATWLTRSKGAWAAALIGAAVWVAGTLLVGRYALPRVRVLVLGWLTFAAAGLGLTAWGLFRGELPGSSLNFRWGYWTASAELIGDHPLTGVGRENFGRAYLRYKSIESPEEIANPHNLFVQAFAEMGAVGELGVLALLFGASLALSRPPESSSADPKARGEPGAGIGSTLLWTVGLGAAVFACRIPLLGTDDPDYVYVSTAVPALIWMLTFGLFAVSFRQTLRIATSIPPPVHSAINAALVAFLVQETVNFGLFVPGAAVTVFALAAAGISGRRAVETATGSERPRTRRSIAATNAADRADRAKRPDRLAWAPALVAAASVAAFAALAWPVARGQAALYAARSVSHVLEAGPVTGQRAYQYYVVAARVDRLDPTPWAELADWLAAVADRAPTIGDEAWAAAVAAARDARVRDPLNVQMARRLTRMAMGQARHSGQVEHYRQAVDAAGGVTERYPSDPDAWKLRGDIELEAGRATRAADWVRSSLLSFDRAEELNDARPTWEIFRRFSQRELAEIESAVRQAEEFLAAAPAISSP